MANTNICDSHSAELEYLYTALTDDEQASIQGGRFPKIKIPSISKIKQGVKKAVQILNAAGNVVYVGTGAKKVHDTKGHWWSFL